MPSFSLRSLLPFRRTGPTKEILEEIDDATDSSKQRDQTLEDVDNTAKSQEQRVQIIDVPRRSAEVLRMLPPELWSQISGHLGSVDIAALALSSQLMRSYFDSTWQGLVDQDKYEFLLRLKEWYPTHRACMHCLRYHDLGSQMVRYNVQHDFCAPNRKFDVSLFSMRKGYFMTRSCRCDPFLVDPTYPLDTISWPAIQMATRADDSNSTGSLAPKNLAFETDAALSRAHWNIKTQAVISKFKHILIKVECERPLQKFRAIGKSVLEGVTYDCSAGYINELPHCLHSVGPIAERSKLGLPVEEVSGVPFAETQT